MRRRRGRRARQARRRTSARRIAFGLVGGTALLAVLGGGLAVNSIEDTLSTSEIQEVALGEFPGATNVYAVE